MFKILKVTILCLIFACYYFTQLPLGSKAIEVKESISSYGR